MHIILHQPEIPANTGNIGRTCVATGTSLHLIEPLGFRLDEKNLKRAGMDYWEHLNVTRYMNFQEFEKLHPGAKIWMATTKARRSYTDVSYGTDDFIMFGKESAGIPEEILVEHEENCIRIPMLPSIRSLNLSNSVAIVLYEALRQQQFSRMQKTGELHRLHWKESSAYAAPDADILGNVSLGENSNIWYHATVRADRDSVTVGSGTNIQDNCVIHTSTGFPVSIGNNVTVGHGAIIHGCTVQDNALIGMGAILLNGSVVGPDCIVGAGALIPQNMIVPQGSLVIGCPGKIIRQVTEKEIAQNKENALRYVKEAQSSLNPWQGTSV